MEITHCPHNTSTSTHTVGFVALGNPPSQSKVHKRKHQNDPPESDDAIHPLTQHTDIYQNIPTVQPTYVQPPNCLRESPFAQLIRVGKAMLREHNRLAPSDKDELSHILDICKTIFPFHCGIKTPLPSQAARLRGTAIRYQHIYEDHDMTIGIFIIPPGKVMPLHNHPSMSVVSRLLYGSVKVRTMDIVEKEVEHNIRNEIQAEFQRVQTLTKNQRKKSNGLKHMKGIFDLTEGTISTEYHIAKKQLCGTFLAPATIYLTPTYNNLHEFRGGDEIGCAILDILTPPYDENEGRDCTYYDTPGSFYSQGLGTDVYILRNLDAPSDFELVPELFQGPPI